MAILGLIISCIGVGFLGNRIFSALFISKPSTWSTERKNAEIALFLAGIAVILIGIALRVTAQ